MYLNSNDFYFNSNKKLAQFYFFFLVIFFIFRLIFTFYYSEAGLVSENLGEVALAYWYGFKYDTIAISFLLFPIFLISTILSLFKSQSLVKLFYNFLKAYIFLGSLTYALILSVDIGFYSYFQDHINILIFGFFEDDTKALLQTFYKNYPVFLAGIISIVLVFILFKVTFRLVTPTFKQVLSPNPLIFISQFIIINVLFIGGLRGGYSKLVLSPKYSDFSSNEFINQIAYNGVLSFEKAYKMRATSTQENFKLEDTLGYKNNISKAITDYLNVDNKQSLEIALKKTTPINTVIEKTKPHVVVFLMESFGASWLEFQSEEFNFLGNLKEHIDEDLFTPYMISTGKGTIGSLVGLLTNNPRRPGRRFLSESRYLSVPLKSSMQRPYKESGYNTQFIYGGKLAWRNIGKYARVQGFDELIGEGQIRENLNLEGEQGTEWGLYDEHLYSYIKESLKSATKPQFIFVLTTTNHPPFKTPNTYKKPELKVSKVLESQILRERELFNKRFETFRYTNDKLANFISYIKSDDKLKSKTVVSFTGDHNFWGFKNYSRKEAYRKFTVPFYIYLPRQLMTLEKPKLSPISGHEDIMTTLYHLTLSNANYISFGENLLDPKIKTNAIGAGIYANDMGVIYKNRFYDWDVFPEIKIEGRGVEKSASKYYRSLLSVSDYFIRLQSEPKNQ